MSDILFRYLLMARKRDHSRFRWLFLADEQLLEAGVEQLVESAAARVEVYSQHERVGQHRVTVPASHRNAVRFYDVPEPNRPKAGHFEKRQEEFPLRATLEVSTCTQCHGTGEMRCRKCSGRGQVNCWRCGGSGRVQSSGRRRPCGMCGGAGTRTCPSCHGSGWRTCDLCNGEREIATWDAETYRWLIETRAEESYPLDDGRLRDAFARWLAVDKDLTPGLDRATAAEHLGYETPEAMEVVGRAEATRLRLEGEARGSSDRYLFHRSDCSLAPTGYTVVRLGGKARYFWLVGRGEKAVEIRPRGRADGRKLLGFAGLGTSGAAIWEGVLVGIENAELLAPQLIDSLQIFDGMSPLWLAGGAAGSLLLTASGARRWFAKEDPVRTVGLLPVSGRPTPWLTCLAYLGSYTQRLTVSDRAYDTQLERLLGKMRPARQSESLSLELDDRKLRLVEVARPARLADGSLDLMLRALDGVLLVEEKGQGSDGFETRLRSAAKSGNAALRIGKVVIDRGSELGATGDSEGAGTVPIEAIRRTFVEDIGSEVDWDELFERIWQPVEKVLGL